MNSNVLNETIKYEMANEVEQAIKNKNRTIKDSPHKDYLNELLQSNDPFNKYYNKFCKNRNSHRLYIAIDIIIFIGSYIYSKKDPQIDFLRFALELMFFVTFITFFIQLMIFSIHKKKLMKHYIPIIKNNLNSLQIELQTPITKERAQYVGALYYICNYIYTTDKYTFRHFKC